MNVKLMEAIARQDHLTIFTPEYNDDDRHKEALRLMRKKERYKNIAINHHIQCGRLRKLLESESKKKQLIEEDIEDITLELANMGY